MASVEGNMGKMYSWIFSLSNAIFLGLNIYFLLSFEYGKKEFLRERKRMSPTQCFESGSKCSPTSAVSI